MEATLDTRELHRLSADEYRRMVQAGVLDEDDRVELIDGLLAATSPKTRAHENAVAWLGRFLMLGVDLTRFEVRTASPLSIGNSEPEPDLAVIPVDAPRPNHPATASLVIEVAVSSLERDLAVKPAIYGAAGIPEYWVLDLAGRRLVAHRGPTEADGYREAATVCDDDSIEAQALPLPRLALADVPAAADA